jgi:hypothetical protein
MWRRRSALGQSGVGTMRPTWWCPVVAAPALRQRPGPPSVAPAYWWWSEPVARAGRHHSPAAGSTWAAGPRCSGSAALRTRPRRWPDWRMPLPSAMSPGRPPRGHRTDEPGDRPGAARALGGGGTVTVTASSTRTPIPDAWTRRRCSPPGDRRRGCTAGGTFPVHPSGTGPSRSPRRPRRSRLMLRVPAGGRKL